MSRTALAAAIALTGLGMSFGGAHRRGFHFAPDNPASPATGSVQALREEYTRVHGEAGALNELIAKENRAMTTEEETAQNQRYTRLDDIKKRLDANAQHAKYALEAGKATTVTNPPGQQ